MVCARFWDVVHIHDFERLGGAGQAQHEEVNESNAGIIKARICVANVPNYNRLVFVMILIEIKNC